MKASELRIGNLLFGVSDKIETVFAIHRGVVESGMLLKLSEERFLQHMKPIPVTPEWFERFGAKKHGHGSGYLINSYYFSKVGGGSYQAGILFSDNSITTLTSFKYVHQLQNLYFALTGEELAVSAIATKVK